MVLLWAQLYLGDSVLTTTTSLVTRMLFNTSRVEPAPDKAYSHDDFTSAAFTVCSASSDHLRPSYSKCGVWPIHADVAARDACSIYASLHAADPSPNRACRHGTYSVWSNCVQVLLEAMSKYAVTSEGTDEAATARMQSLAMLTDFQTQLTAKARAGHAADTINAYTQPEMDKLMYLTININKLLYESEDLKVGFHRLFTRFVPYRKSS